MENVILGVLKKTFIRLNYTKFCILIEKIVYIWFLGCLVEICLSRPYSPVPSILTWGNALNLLLDLPARGLKSTLLIGLALLTLQACTEANPPSTARPVVLTPEVSKAAPVGPAVPILVDVLPRVTNRGVGHPNLVTVGDLLEVDIYQEDSLDKTVRVDSTGKILLPLIGTIPAAGRTIQGLARTLENRYRGKHLQNPEITVFIAETQEPMVTVDGAINEPGIYPVNDKTTLLQIMAVVGGFTEVADPKKVYIFRDYSGQKYVANYSVAAIREGQIVDPKIYEDDIIVSFESKAKVGFKNLGQALGIAAIFATLSRR